jgi:hypothetical protein
VQIQLWMTAAAMNIKRAVRQTARETSPGGLLSLHARLRATCRPPARRCPSFRPSLSPLA